MVRLLYLGNPVKQFWDVEIMSRIRYVGPKSVANPILFVDPQLLGKFALLGGAFRIIDSRILLQTKEDPDRLISCRREERSSKHITVLRIGWDMVQNIHRADSVKYRTCSGTVTITSREVVQP